MADSDLINALSTANRSSSVLQGIANPPQINPLAAITAGNQAAQAEFQTRGMQAQQAIGQILQQSTDENGNVDFQKAHRMAASAGPMVQMGMMKFAQDASALKGAQIEQASASHTFASRLAASGVEDSSDANWANIRAQAVNANAPPQVVAEIDRIRALPEDQRSGVAMQHLKTNLAALESLQQIQGKRQTVTTPGGTYDYTQPPPGRGTVFTPNGPAPGDTQEGGSWVDAEGKPTQQGAPGAVWQPSVTPKANMPQFPQGGPPQVTPEGGGGVKFPPPPPFIPTGQQPPSSAPPSTQEAAPPASGPGSVGNTPGRGNYVRPKFDPQTGERLPDGPGLSAPSPGRAGGVPDSPSTHQALPAKPAPAQPGDASIPTGPPKGYDAKLSADIAASSAARLAMGDQQKQLIAGQSALDALKLADTGPSTGFFAKAYAFLKAQGITTVERGQLSDTDYRQLLQKNLLRFAQDNGSKAGTDLGLETKLHSNANADEMLAGANRHVLIQDMGVLKRDITQTQEMPEPSGTGDVVKHIGSFPANTAPEAFMWNHYTNEERDAIEKEYKDKGQTQKLHDSLALAVKRGAIPDPRPKAAPPQRGSFLVPPPGPRVNALSMVG